MTRVCASWVLKEAAKTSWPARTFTMLNSWAKVGEEQGWEKGEGDPGSTLQPDPAGKAPPTGHRRGGRDGLGHGSEIAQGCDFPICTTRASFSQPEINLGIIPGGGGSQRLPRIVGKAKAMQIIMTGSPITAEEAYKWGWPTRSLRPRNSTGPCRSSPRRSRRKAPS